MRFWGGLGPVPEVSLIFLLQSHLKTHRVIIIDFKIFVKYHKTQKKGCRIPLPQPYVYITVLSTTRTGLEVSKSQRPSRPLYHTSRTIGRQVF